MATDAPTAVAPKATVASPPPDCLALPQWSTPSTIRLAVLAFLVPGPSSPAHATWINLMGEGPATPLNQAHPTLAAVWALPPRQRQPWLAHVVQRARSLPPGPQAQTLREAEALVQPQGEAPLPACLTLCLIRHTLTAAEAATDPSVVAPPRRPLSLADATPDIWRVSLALGQLARPESGTGPAADRTGAHAWAMAVMKGLGLAWPVGLPVASGADSDWAALHASIHRLAGLGPLQQPALVKQWVQWGALPSAQPLADALHSLCLLIGSPMPPPLQACFDALPDTVSASLFKKF